MNAALAFAGRHGPVLLFFGVLIGFLFPDLAAAAKPWMGASVFVFTLGAFLKVDGKAFRAELDRPSRAVAVLVWTLAGVPALAWVLVWVLVWVLDLPAEIGLAIMLCMLAPPVGSAAAMAAMLGLNAALALAATIAISLLAPLYLPLYLPLMAAPISGTTVQVDALAMLGRIVAVIGAAVVVAALLRRFAGAFVARNPSAMTGVSVVGLITVAIGAMHGMPQLVLGHGMQTLQLMGLAFAVNVGFQLVGCVLFSRLGIADALTVGLVSGNRNVTLVWVVVAPWLDGLPMVEAYLAASVFPIFMLPLLTKWLMALGARGQPQVVIESVRQ